MVLITRPPVGMESRANGRAPSLGWHPRAVKPRQDASAAWDALDEWGALDEPGALESGSIGRAGRVGEWEAGRVGEPGSVAGVAGMGRRVSCPCQCAVLACRGVLW